MARIAVYSLKGGVGKTTLAVNLAWCAAMLSARRTLLWDLDPQAAASFIVRQGKAPKKQADGVYEQEIKAKKLIRPTSIDRLDLLSADASLRGLDRLFFDIGKKKRLSKVIDGAARDYDRIILDCAPGFGETAEQALHAADIVLVPVIPSPLSQRAFDEVAKHVERNLKGKTSMLPVHMMVDRRRKLHLQGLEEHPKWPVIPYASVAEQVAARREPVGAFAPRSDAAQAFAKLWRGVEKRIAKGL